MSLAKSKQFQTPPKGIVRQLPKGHVDPPALEETNLYKRLIWRDKIIYTKEDEFAGGVMKWVLAKETDKHYNLHRFMLSGTKKEWKHKLKESGSAEHLMAFLMKQI